MMRFPKEGFPARQQPILDPSLDKNLALLYKETCVSMHSIELLEVANDKRGDPAGGKA